MTDEAARPGESKNEELLREIREDYTYLRDYWRENFEEAKIDLRFVAGDPWDPNERQAREDNNRPVLSPDELSQYLNQAINNLRQNKKQIKVNPAGPEAKDEDADRRSAIIQGIEYKSNAQGAYINAFENVINCGIGQFRITTKFIGKDKEVEPRIKIIENPISVLPDANAKEPDFSDMKRCFVLDVMRQSDFKRKYPNATKQSFTPEDMTVASGWFPGGENIIVAEYWSVEGEPGDDDVKVTQYITNGVEILEKNKWPGKWIPIIIVAGKKIYLPVGSEMKRFYYSMVRKARGPQMMLAYIASQEAEEYGMAPRAPFVGYVGQFETDKDAWDSLNKIPRPYVQVDPTVDGSNGQLLPLPTRPAFIPNAQAYEVGKESWRRAIQAAMGITPLPTAAQRQNEKSGVALERIESQQSIGSFHFTDNFGLALENAGRQLNDLIGKTMDTPRHVGIRNPDGSHGLLAVAPQGTMPEGAQPEGESFDPTKGEFDVTISSGPSYQSQRQEASSFVDLITQNLAQIPPPGSPQAKILAMGVRMKALGSIGDEIADILDPQEGEGQIPPQVQAAMQKMQQDHAALNAHAQQLEKQLGQFQFEKTAKTVEHQGKMEEIAAKAQADMALEDKKLLAQITIAEIGTKAQIVADREADRRALEAQWHDQAHDVGMAAVGHQQAQDMQAQQADTQSQQSAQDAAQSQAAQESAQAQQEGAAQ